MWIDYEKSKKAVERCLYTCRDYMLKGYFTIENFGHLRNDLSLGIVSAHYQNRFSTSSDGFKKLETGSYKGNQNLRKLLDQEEQMEWFRNVIEAVNKLDGKYREIIIYHYLKGYSLNELKEGVIEEGIEIKISKAYEKNNAAIMKLMIYLDDCLIPYVGEIDINKLTIKHKVGAINFVKKKMQNTEGENRQ